MKTETQTPVSFDSLPAVEQEGIVQRTAKLLVEYYNETEPGTWAQRRLSELFAACELPYRTDSFRFRVSKAMRSLVS